MLFPTRPSCRSRLLLSALLLGALSARAQPPPRDAVQTTGRSIIRGRVLAGDSGTPMRRAFVRLNSPALRESRAAATDTDGRYEFSQLAAGRYTISVNKPAYVNWSYGQTRPNGPGKPIVLLDNQLAENVDIRLPRGGVIAGRVVDEFGEP